MKSLIVGEIFIGLDVELDSCEDKLITPQAIRAPAFLKEY